MFGNIVKVELFLTLLSSFCTCYVIYTGHIPLCWKQSIITPLFKKDDPILASNYGPISLASIACKIKESVVCDALLTHLNTHKFLSANQHGFI
jgi:hypothetical protein